MTPAYSRPAVPPFDPLPQLAHEPIPSYLGLRHPTGPGVHPLPSPSGLDLIGITDAHGVVRVLVAAEPEALDAQATAMMRAWWRRRWRAVLLRLL
jgi:hypothetical protein